VNEWLLNKIDARPLYVVPALCGSFELEVAANEWSHSILAKLAKFETDSD
jgi:hypothetical protein